MQEHQFFRCAFFSYAVYCFYTMLEGCEIAQEKVQLYGTNIFFKCKSMQIVSCCLLQGGARGGAPLAVILQVVSTKIWVCIENNVQRTKPIILWFVAQKKQKKCSCIEDKCRFSKTRIEQMLQICIEKSLPRKTCSPLKIVSMTEMRSRRVSARRTSCAAGRAAAAWCCCRRTCLRRSAWGARSRSPLRSASGGPSLDQFSVATNRNVSFQQKDATWHGGVMKKSTW